MKTKEWVKHYNSLNQNSREDLAVRLKWVSQKEMVDLTAKYLINCDETVSVLYNINSRSCNNKERKAIFKETIFLFKTLNDKNFDECYRKAVLKYRIKHREQIKLYKWRAIHDDRIGQLHTIGGRVGGIDVEDSAAVNEHCYCRTIPLKQEG